MSKFTIAPSVLRRIQIFWSYFIGIGAFFGGIMMIISPKGAAGWGMDPLLEYMQVLPWPEIFFANFVFPGICLLCVNGITNLAAIIMMHRNERNAPVAGLICGIILMLWICVQFIIFPFNFMSTTYFFFGLFQAGNAVCWIKLNKA